MAQALQFCIEFLVLMAHVLSEVADLIIEDLLELIPYKIDFLVLLLDHVHEILPALLHYFLQPIYLIVLLLLNPLVFLVNGSVGA